jgi:hypothetical protein
MLQRLPSFLNGPKLDSRRVQASYTFCVGRRLFQRREELYLHDFVRLLLVACTMVLGSTQPLTEMSTKNLPGGKGRPARKADNLTAIYDQIV